MRGVEHRERPGPLSRALTAPNLPRRAALGVDLFQLLTIFEGVHRHPEAVVAIGRQLVLANQAVEWLADELFSLPHIVEDLTLQDEEAAVDADVGLCDVVDRLHAPARIGIDDVIGNLRLDT